MSRVPELLEQVLAALEHLPLEFAHVAVGELCHCASKTGVRVACVSYAACDWLIQVSYISA